jgi:hypothetical protein
VVASSDADELYLLTMYTISATPHQCLQTQESMKQPHLRLLRLSGWGAVLVFNAYDTRMMRLKLLAAVSLQL